MTSYLPETTAGKRRASAIILSLLLLLVLLAGAYFRFTGLSWGENQYLHPDERFLVWVGADISPVQSLSEYFNTAVSSLNPNNRGHGFYVYGTLPMFLTRYVVEWIYGHSGFAEMTSVGRALSALADLVTVLLVFSVAERLYDQRVGILAAAFSAAAVLQIQQSHFFTMDTFVTMFTFLAFAFAVWILKVKNGPRREDEGERFDDDPDGSPLSAPVGYGQDRTSPGVPFDFGGLVMDFVRDPLFLPSLGFGISLGMAVASKLNAALVAAALPAAMILYLLRTPAEERLERAFQAAVYLAMAAFVSLLVFRIFQPYAFSGPGFFGIKPNPVWVQNIQEQRAQSSRAVDFPPAMQWARRPVWFSFQNMVSWGLGLPMGILAWAGFIWAGWRLLTRWNRRTTEWTSHALIWGWTAIYFAWQSIQLNPTMRYELPIYPTLTILAAWAVIALYDFQKKRRKTGETAAQAPGPRGSTWARIGAVVVGGIVLLPTYAYAYGFTQIYVRPITRIAASRWIYQNIPGPINLPIETDAGIQNQVIPFPYDYRIQSQLPYTANFQPKKAGLLSQIVLPRVVDESALPGVRTLSVAIYNVPAGTTPVASGSVTADLSRTPDGRGQDLVVMLDKPVTLDPARYYILTVSLPFGNPTAILDSRASLVFEPYSNMAENAEQAPKQSLSVHLGVAELQPTVPLTLIFQAGSDGLLSELDLYQLPGQENTLAPQPLGISLQPMDPNAEPLYSAVELQEDPASRAYQVKLADPIPVNEGERYRVTLSMEPRGGMVALYGMAIANEGEWDDGLPLRLDGNDGYGGIYPLDLSFNMYWEDNQTKLDRFERILDQSDYITISSNRQWGSLPRISERFPMTTAYYRSLIGCPAEQTIEYCYRVAEPGTYTGNLGFQLVKVFTSDPSIGPVEINDQFAEEAFTVYDHPKVFVFKKTSDYDAQKVHSILGGVDFSKIIRKPPLTYSDHPEDLTLPESRLAEQQLGGTWSDLFNPQAAINRIQPLGALVWYLSVALLGLFFYPILRLALPGLDDRGYPLGRIAGMLTLSYLVWLAGSFQVPFTRLTISVAIGLLVLAGATLAYWQRKELIEDWRSRRRYFLIIEGLALAFFLAFLLVRFGNPDLWHPFKGGEKPMDFSFFNAILKSTTFPPYDPWYAGGYMNYYYYGYLLVGVLVKWLGIVPSIAYNLILPTLFSMLALGAFSIAWNLTRRAHASRASPDRVTGANRLSPYIPAISASLGMAVLGNLGVIKMIYEGYQKLGAPDGVISNGNLFNRIVWAAEGFLRTLNGAHLPYALGDWYWNPSRIIPAPGDVEPITEFPYFTLLYADLHAHLIALSLTLLALALVVGIILSMARWKNAAGGVLWFLLAGLSIGSLRPTNTWDLPTYLAFGVIGTFYAIWRYYPMREFPPPVATGAAEIYDLEPESSRRRLDWWYDIPPRLRRLVVSFGGAGLLAVLALLLFQPFAHWYALGYTQIDAWHGTHTPLSAYLYHWGLFLLVIVAWMVWETRDWLANTPVSALNTLKRYQILIEFLLAVLLCAVVLLVFWEGAAIAWLVLPLAAWAGILILRPGQPEAKRIVLFLVGTGLVLTLMVEVIVLHGDIGRMNTVFKFYLQVWTMFSVSAAASLGWLWPALADWSPNWRRAWQAAFTLLVAGASLYPIMASMAKVEDRMSPQAPHTLDGMTYMAYSTYTDTWGTMDLSQDYDAIRWMQENVKGSPVIVEANLRNLYRWGSRYTVYTGLPGVVGWEWHEQQQRTTIPATWITDRIFEIDAFYLTTDWNEAAAFLRKYHVQYVVVGQQERGHYPGLGLEKFDQANGILWKEVYRKGETVIYQVMETSP